MIGKPLRRISTHDLWIAVALAVAVAVLALVVAFHFVEPAPPDRVVMSTGTVDGGYQMFAQRYKEILARDGVTVDLRISAGSQENVSRLLDQSADVEVGFFQGEIGRAHV